MYPEGLSFPICMPHPLQMETTHNFVKDKLVIKVIKLVECLIGWEVTLTGPGSDCPLTYI